MKFARILILIGSGALIVTLYLLLRGQKRLGHVDSAIGSIRVLVEKENNFAQSHAAIGYACTLSTLPNDSLTAELVTKGQRNGYAFQIGCPVEDTKRPHAKYTVTARPLITGMAAFCSDETGVVKYDDSGSVERCLEHGIPIG
jgi:hypothetical protein